MVQLHAIQLQLGHLFQKLFSCKLLRQAMEFLVLSLDTGVHVVIVSTAMHLLVVLDVRAIVTLVHLGDEGCKSGCLVAAWLQFSQE